MNKQTPIKDIYTLVNKPIISLREWNINSNSLCNYMKDIVYLKDKLEKRALIPRYVSEEIGYLGIRELWRVAFPMICFCDIPFSKINVHIDKYGGYGIAFDKIKILEKYGLQPIHYISDNSPLKRDYKEAFQFSLNSDLDGDNLLKDYLLSSLLFMKPVYRESLEDGVKNRYIFQNECEWRYVPDLDLIPNDMELLLINDDATKKSCNLYSGVLVKHQESWLRFDWDDVKYIIVPNESDSIAVIELINSFDINEMCKSLLISKIVVWKSFLEDV